MSRLSYRDSVDIYRATEDGDEQWWSLVEDFVPVRIAALDSYSALQESEVYQFQATHRGRCTYNENLDVAGADRRLLVREKDGKQFMVIGWREGRARRGGNPEMILSLAVQRQTLYNLRDT